MVSAPSEPSKSSLTTTCTFLAMPEIMRMNQVAVKSALSLSALRLMNRRLRGAADHILRFGPRRSSLSVPGWHMANARELYSETRDLIDDSLELLAGEDKPSIW